MKRIPVPMAVVALLMVAYIGVFWTMALRRHQNLRHGNPVPQKRLAILLHQQRLANRSARLAHLHIGNLSLQF